MGNQLFNINQAFLWLIAILLCALLNDAIAKDADTITIGIISPKGGSSLVLAGETHEESIRLAFSHLEPLQLGDLQIRLELSPWNDSGDPQKSAEGALKLAREDHVVAILGPVNSGSTKEVLKRLKEEQIELPVISALSTAPELTFSGLRDKNFFRLIFDDADRMGQYATFIKQEKGKEGEKHFLFLYEQNPYGEGLNTSLKDRFYTPNVVSRSWHEILKQDCIDKNNVPYPSDNDALRSGQCFQADFINLFEEYGINNIVLLGETSGSLSLVSGLKQAIVNLNTDYFFVGSSKRLLDEAPVGSLTIGDPVLDYHRAPTPELGNDWQKLLNDFEERAKKNREDFVMTAYEAAMIVHHALRIVLSGQRTLPAVGDLRKQLLQVLENETFDSLEPWRTISFSQGKLDQIPTAPIYRISRGVIREDEISTHPWVHLTVDQHQPWLEAPVEVHLQGYGVESAKLAAYRVDNFTQHEHLIEERLVKFSAGLATERFHLLQRGAYHFKILDAPFYPTLTETRIVLTNHYLISAIAALVGAILAISHTVSSLLTRIIRVMTGIATCLLLTFGSFYGQQFSGWLPFPSFGSEPVVNAMLTGLLGGLAGPHLLANTLSSWAKRWLLPSQPG
ncbi:MAG: hypothetical protein A4S08_12000 [Proteobacteria bacterium SG_bin4]|nr:MAG: hypothetical protein A4S08_12000 [Proteobacteria bacterium SG_bin4]